MENHPERIKMYSKRRFFISSIRDLNIIGSAKISLYLAKILIPKPKKHVIIRTLYNFDLIVDPAKDRGVETSLFYFRTYEKGTLKLMEELLRKGDCFVDVGANIGLMSIYGSYLVGEQGKIIAFEPNPITRSILEENVKLNNLGNIKIEGLAVSNESKSSKIYDRWDINRGGASLLKPAFKTQSYDIEETTLSEYFADLPKIKLIKLDVEGYELEALKGAEKLLLIQNPPMLIIECSSAIVNSFGKMIIPLYEYLLKINKYRIFKSIKGKGQVSKLIEIKNESHLPKHDNIYCFTTEHLLEIPEHIFQSKLNQ